MQADASPVAAVSGAPAADAAGTEKTSVYGHLMGRMAIYGLPLIFRALAGLSVIPIYTRYLAPGDYGLLELLDLTALTIATFVAGSFGQALCYSYTREPPNRRALTVSSAFCGALLLGSLPALLGFAGAPYVSTLLFNTPRYAGMVQLILWTIALSFPAEISFSAMRVMDKARLYSGLSLVQLFLGLGLNLTLLVGLRWGVLGLLWSNFTVSAASALYSTWFCFPYLRASFELKMFYQLFRYSLPLNLSSLAAIILNYGDRFVLQRNVPMSQLGIYSLAYKIGLMTNFLYLTFNIAWRARMFAIVDGANGAKVYVRMCTYLALALTFTTVVIALMVRPAVHIGVGAAYQDCVPLVPWIAGIYVIKCVGEYFRNTFQLEAKTHRDTQIAWIGSAVCAAGYLLLIPRFKLWGAVLATGISFAYMFFDSYRKAQRVRRFEFELRRLGLICLAAGVTLVAYWLISPVTILWQIVAGVLLAFSFPLLLLVLGFVEEDEKRLFASAVVRQWPGSAGLVRRAAAAFPKGGAS